MGHKKSALVDDMSNCIVCGSPYVEVHHVFFGYKRALSDSMGYVLPLCNYHHTGSNLCPHKCRETDLKYKRMAQRHFEAFKGSRETFIQLFNKSYL